MCFGGNKTEDQFKGFLTSLIPSEISKREEALTPLEAYGSKLMTEGLPDFNAMKDYSTGTVATDSGTARNAILRNLASSGIKMTDPAAQGVMGDFEASRARAYDQNLNDLIKMNQAAKQSGAGIMSAVGAARSPYPALSMFGNLALNG